MPYQELLNQAMQIWVDADACPVKDETMQVAARHNLKTYLVSDGGIRPNQNPMVELVIVDQGPPLLLSQFNSSH